MEEEKAHRPIGLFYVAANAAIFIGLWLWPATDGFSDWTISHTWVEPAATAGELTVMSAAILATIFPKGFLWTFGRLIRLVIQFWQSITGFRPQAEGDAGFRARPAPKKSHQYSRARPPPTEQLDPPDWQPWAILVIVVLSLTSSMFFRDPVERNVAPPPSPPTVTEVDSSNDQQEPINPRPATVTITTERSCEEIAARYCRVDAWPEFTAENSIRVVRRGSRQICIINPGQKYRLPVEWTDEHCRASPSPSTP